MARTVPGRYPARIKARIPQALADAMRGLCNAQGITVAEGVRDALAAPAATYPIAVDAPLDGWISAAVTSGTTQRWEGDAAGIRQQVAEYVRRGM